MTRSANPFIGPRAFQYGETLYGREQELRELLDLIIAERIVLMYSPSGAGKSSLIQASLIPALERAAFKVIPCSGDNCAGAPRSLRVSQVPADQSQVPANANRYLLSLLLSLDEALPEEHQSPVAELAGTDLSGYLKRYEALTGTGPGESIFLVIDQFEEILTLDPADRSSKEKFFAQLGAALKDRDLWALFAMREEFLGGLDPYLRSIPTRLKTTFRLDLLGPDAAKIAVQRPAQGAGVSLEDDAAEKLVDDLRMVRVQRADGGSEERPGLYVEPVQLQVVCRRLWDQLEPGVASIDLAQVEALGDVNAALSLYYAEKVREVAAASGVSERKVREWFERSLITEQGIRGQVLQGAGESAGLANAAVAGLVDAHLVRAEKRRSFIWYELAHDRLINPVRRDNEEWFQAHLNVLQRQAQLWESQHRPGGMLLAGDALEEAELWAREHPCDLNQEESAFLAECVAARTQARREKRMNLFLRVAMALALVSLAFGWFELRVAKSSEAKAHRLKVVAEANAARAEANAREARKNAAEAVRNADRARSNAEEAELQKRAALQQKQLALSNAALALRHQMLAESYAEQSHQSAARADLNATKAQENADEARRQAEVALSRQLAAQSGLRLADQPDLGLLLSLEANDVHPGLDAQGSLLSALSRTSSLEKYLRYHTEAASKVAFSPRGGLVASAGADGVVVLWKTGSQHPLGRPLKGHRAEVTGLAFGGDGEVMASGDASGTVIVRDLARGTAETLPEAHRGAVRELLFSADDPNSLTSSGEDGRVRWWRRKEGGWQAEPARDVRLAGPVFTVAISPDGSLVAASDGGNGSNQGSFTLYDGNTGKKLAGPIGAHDSTIGALAFSRHGRLLASCGGLQCAVWDVSTPGSPRPATRALTGHSNTVHSAAFRGDDRMLVTASSDRSVRIWSLETGQQTGRPLLGHEGGVYHAAFSPDGREVASAGADGTVILWSYEARQRFGRESPPKTVPVVAVAVAPDGDIAASAGMDGSIVFWSTVTHRMLGAPIHGHGVITSLSFDGGGKKLAGGSNDSSVRVWDTGTGTLIHGPYPHDAAVSAVAFHPARDLVATADNRGVIRLWDNATGARLGSDLWGHDGTVWDLSFSSDGSLLASAGEDGKVRLWDTRKMRQAGEPLAGHDGAVYGVAFMHRSGTLASAGADGRIYLWDTTAGHPVGKLFVQREGWFRKISFSADDSLLASSGRSLSVWDTRTGKITTGTHGETIAADGISTASFGPGTLLATGGEDGALRLWDAASLKPKGDPMAGHHTYVSSLAVSDDGKICALGHGDGSITVKDCRPDQPGEMAFTRHGGEVSALKFLAQGKLLVAATRQDRSITVWDLESGESRFLKEASFQEMAFSPDGSLAALSTRQGEINILNLASEQEFPPLRLTGSGERIRMAFHPKLPLLAAAQGSSVSFFDLATGETRCVLNSADDKGVYSLAFNPAGTMLATGGKDSLVHLWDTGDPAHPRPIESGRLKGHGGAVLSVAFSPDGKTIASGGIDQSIRVWNVEHLQQLGPTLTKHTDSVVSLAFADRGRILVSGGADGRTLLWDMDAESWRGAACRIAQRNFSDEERALYLGDKKVPPVCFQEMLIRADRLAFQERRAEAEKAYRETVQNALDHGDYLFRNSVCRFGAIDGFAALVLPACNRSVLSAPEERKDAMRDSRAVALALSGDYPGAIEDFESFLSWCAERPECRRQASKREMWVDALREGRNPFDRETLENLRIE